MSEFAIPACANCGHAVWPPRLACSACGHAEWTEVPAPSGTVVELTDAPGADGEPIRLATIALAVLFGPLTSKRNSGNAPLVVARCEGCERGDEVALELRDGALLGRRK
jgi:uncharacterized OB-fold protein